MEIVIPYRPRPGQQQLHDLLVRFLVACIHRRFGKTVFGVNWLIKICLSTNLPFPRCHYVAPFLKQAKAVAWDYVQQFTRSIPGMQYNQNELRADFANGARIELCGAENYDKHRGKYSDGVVFDEVAQMPPAVWREVFRPALSDRLGRAVFIGTPQGHNFFKVLFDDAKGLPDWGAILMTAEDTGVIDPAELEALQREMSAEEYDQEFMCNWEAANAGAFYAAQMATMREDARIREVPFEDALPVITAWDIGIRDATVITYWQVHGSEARIIDCDEHTGVGLPEMVKHVQAKPYNYAEHIGPHDIDVRELGTGKTRIEAARDLGLRFKIAPKLPVMDGINAVRSLLGRTWIDQSKCFDLIEALRQYTAEYDDVRRVYAPRPLHNWASHYADSVRYFATGYSGRRGDWSKPIDYSQVTR